MASTDDVKDRPPGQQRPYPAPSKSGQVAFTPPGTNLECKTHYSIYGTLDINDSATQLPLICIHGGPGATSTYMQPFGLLQVDYGVPVIIYDQLGCGQSTRLRDKKGDTDFWTVELFVAELQNLLDALHISTRSFDLLGHSWGAWIAVKFATQHVVVVDQQQQQRQEQQHRPSQKLRKLIIAQSTADMPLRQSYFEKQMENLPSPHGESATLAHQTGDTSTPAYKLALEAWSHHHMCRLSPWPAEFTACMAALSEDDTVSSTLGGPMLKLDIRGCISKLSAEVVPGGMLILNGKYDQSMDEVVRPFVELPPVPGVRREWVRFERSGHMAMLEETEEIMGVVGRWLGRE